MVVNSATYRATKPHVLTGSDFSALAEGRGSAELIEFLWSAERSRRLLLIKSLLDSAERNPALLGPLPDADAAWAVLGRAQRVEPSALDPVLLHPQVGTALSYALRRLTGGAVAGRGGAGGGSARVAEDCGDPPLWVDFGHIHTVGLVVAARARLTWRTAVPLRNGRVMLPGLGLAEFPGIDGFDRAVASTAGGRIWLECRGVRIDVPPDPGRDAPHWLGLRRLDLAGPPDLTIWLDDLDPFRDLSDPVPPARLDERDLSNWRDLLGTAWRIIRADLPETATALAAGIASVVPLPAAEGWDNRSASTGEAFGSVMVSPPSDPTSLAVVLVHEFQHIKLGGLMHLITLTEGDEAAVLYAPWRDDPRPLAGLAQGAYAFLGIASFWRSHRERLDATAALLATFEYVYAREQTRDALDILRASRILTPLGREFVDRMRGHVRGWLDDEIPPPVMDMVRIVVDSHRAGWRIRHLRPRPSDVSTLVEAWFDGTSPPAPGDWEVSPHRDRNWSQGRLGLVRRRFVAPERFGEVLHRAAWAATLTEWDVAMVAGRHDVAMDGYRRELEADPANLDAWTGLGLALRNAGAAGATAASAALLGRPELVLAVDRAIRRAGGEPDPVELASWLGSAAIRDWSPARSSG